MNKIYTPQIEDYVKEVVDILSISDELCGNFFEVETPEDPILGKELLYEIIADKATDNFILGESFILTEEQFYEAFRDVKIRVALQTLKQKNLIDSIEDENGEEIFFLTEKGKNYASTIKSDDNDK